MAGDEGRGVAVLHAVLDARLAVGVVGLAVGAQRLLRDRAGLGILQRYVHDRDLLARCLAGEPELVGHCAVDLRRDVRGSICTQPSNRTYRRIAGHAAPAAVVRRGLPTASAVRLPAFAAALLGLRELRRVRVRNLSRARCWGPPAASSMRRGCSAFSHRQMLHAGPRTAGFRLALAPMTNDFVALLKDSSLVSVPDRHGAHEADADFCHEHRQLGDSRLDVRPPVPPDVPSVVGAGAKAGAPFEDARGMSEQAPLELRDVSVRRGDRTILERVSFRVKRGGLVALMGPSGSGNTPPLRTIVGLYPFDAGVIVVDGFTLQSGITEGRVGLRRLSTRVGPVFQFHCLFEHLVGHRQRDARADARSWRQAGGGERAGHRPPDGRSAWIIARARFRANSRVGEAQRVAIARALAVIRPSS